MIIKLIKNEKPISFFLVIAGFFAASSVILMLPILAEFFATGLVPRLPTAVLSMSMMILGFLSLACGLILDTVTRGRCEIKRMRYLNIPVIEGVKGKEMGCFLESSSERPCFYRTESFFPMNTLTVKSATLTKRPR